MTMPSSTHRAAPLLISGFFLKFILFDLVWCAATSFSALSHPETYVTALISALILSLPYTLWACRKTSFALMFILDIWFIANLMYSRTYYVPIPLESYFLAGNLKGYTQSVFESLRLTDALFPLSTIAIMLIMRKKPEERRTFTPLWVLLVAVVAFSGSLILRGGFCKSFEHFKSSAHTYHSTPVLFTLFGPLCYEMVSEDAVLSPEEKDQIESFLESRPSLPECGKALSVRKNCLIIIAESFESWVIGQTIEGQEITPYLNRLVADSTTLYAPHVLTQVNGGRSSDARLMLMTGLLPCRSGAASILYSDNAYLSLPKAMKAANGTKNYFLTVDNEKTWNQGNAVRAYGLDTLITERDFIPEEVFTYPKLPGDRAFFRQCRQKMEKGEVWAPGERVLMLFVTHSGHTPFRVPEEFRGVSFSKAVPRVMNDFMTVAHYTDEAIGTFVEYLKTRPEYAETMIVITGDHEGLASHRAPLRGSAAGQGVVSELPFTPFIVVNSPCGGRYEDLMGQIDMYPTLLSLLGIEYYPWAGLGQSILDKGKRPLAVDPQLRVFSNEGLYSETDPEAERLKEAVLVSDKMLRFDWFAKGVGKIH